MRELQLGGRPPGHKATRHHRHHTRLPLACQRLEGRLWQLYREGLAHDAQTRWTLRALLGLAAFLRRAVAILVLQQPPTAEERGSEGGNPHWPAAPASPANRFPIVAVARALDVRIMQEVVVVGTAAAASGGGAEDGGSSNGAAAGAGAAAAAVTLPPLQGTRGIGASIKNRLTSSI